MNLLDLTAVELANEIKNGNTTAIDAMKAVIDKVEAMEEGLNCYVTFDKEAAIKELRKRTNFYDQKIVDVLDSLV